MIEYKRQGDIELTPKMIEAGETELASYSKYDSAETTVIAIFEAMLKAGNYLR